MTSLLLPKLHSGQAAADRIWYSSRLHASLAAPGGELELRPRFPSAPSGSGLLARGVWGEAEFEILLWGPNWSDPLSRLWPDSYAPPWDELPPVLACALAEAALEKYLVREERATGGKIVFRTVELVSAMTKTLANGLGFAASADENSAELLGWLALPGRPDLLPRLASTLAAGFELGQADWRGGAEWPIEMRMEIGRSLVTVTELVDVLVGDVILLDEYWPARNEVRVRLGKNALWRAAWDSGMFTLGEAIMGDESNAPGIDPEDIEVRITLELDSRLLPLSDVLALSPGSVIDTGRSLVEPVAVKVNGKEVARGELLDLEGRVGVRVLSKR